MPQSPMGRTDAGLPSSPFFKSTTFLSPPRQRHCCHPRRGREEAPTARPVPGIRLAGKGPVHPSYAVRGRAAVLCLLQAEPEVTPVPLTTGLMPSPKVGHRCP